jgi:GNAT superfamily N-acetyltransferase
VIRISTDASEIDMEWLHAALSERAYWALGRSREALDRSVANSLSFSAFDGDRQVGYARVVTDEATFAWVCDVFVDETARGQGIGKLLMAAITGDLRP